MGDSIKAWHERETQEQTRMRNGIQMYAWRDNVLGAGVYFSQERPSPAHRQADYWADPDGVGHIRHDQAGGLHRDLARIKPGELWQRSIERGVWEKISTLEEERVNAG